MNVVAVAAVMFVSVVDGDVDDGGGGVDDDGAFCGYPEPMRQSRICSSLEPPGDDDGAFTQRGEGQAGSTCSAGPASDTVLIPARAA